MRTTKKRKIVSGNESDTGVPTKKKSKKVKLMKKQRIEAGKKILKRKRGTVARKKKRQKGNGTQPSSQSTSGSADDKHAESKTNSSTNLDQHPESNDNAMRRAHPHIFVVGTPGVGKTTFSKKLAELSSMRHVEVSQLIETKKLYQEWDDEMNCSIFDDDMVVDELEKQLAASPQGAIVDWHCCDLFPEEWFDLVVVLRCANDVLYPRLEKRGYSAKKISENIEAEIFEVIAEEARAAFTNEKLLERQSETHDNMKENLKEAQDFVKTWRSS